MSNGQVFVYHFEKTFKFYLGCELAHPCPLSGTPLLPYSATFIRPPLLNIDGPIIACFDEASQEWQVKENNFWRPKVKESNYNAGRKMATYEPISLSLFKDFPSYPSIPMICSGAIVAMNISERFRHTHEKFDSVCTLHKLIMAGPVVMPPQHEKARDIFAPHMTYKLEVEALVYQMRRILDTLTQITYLITNTGDFQKNKEIAHSEIGRVANLKSANSDFEKILIGDGIEYEADVTGFLDTVNSLFNSFKHCLVHEENCLIMGVDAPTIVSYAAKHNKYNNEIVYHNHNAFHIMMGFQDSVLRIMKNQKYYQSLKAD